MTCASAPDLRVLHAVRVVGFAEVPALARRAGVDAGVTEDLLLDAAARGWVTHAAFAGLGGWSLTAAGRAEGERRLAAELTDVDGRDEVRAVHRDFLPLNARLQEACTRWQLHPTPADPLASNDHADTAWDAAVLDDLAAVESGLVPLAARLVGVLQRFAGYDERFAAARRRAAPRAPGWVAGTDVDSCHRVWFELHEDLVATLGVERGTEG